ncbi:MAG: riboflavin synthase [Gammaproteobacteria bacterium]|nr:riboflavin synthase [Gammaproteobacteria bacterium]
MFTGIIQAVGSIESIESTGGDMRLTIASADLQLGDSALGDSIAVNGVCLTAVAYQEHGFVADVSLETLGKTSLGLLKQGNQVNLEKALTLNTALGGHLVSGHVDGIGRVVSMQGAARSIRYCFEVDPALQHYIAIKGSVAVDGASLTVNGVENNRFDVNIVPHTQQKTIFTSYQENTQVNIEVDIIARYLERLISARVGNGAEKDNQLLATLTSSGFINPSIATDE